jgi:hypothetical protein
MNQENQEIVRLVVTSTIHGCIKPERWPVPLIRGLFERIGDCKLNFISAMDLTLFWVTSGPFAPATQILTASACFAGVYHFTRLPFGLTRAPFQEQMATTMLFGLSYIIREINKGDAQFLDRLELVSQRFLFVKAIKCKFGLSSIEFVGKAISAAGFSMVKEKIESVLDFPHPKENTILRAANYFRDICPEHSTIVAATHRMIDLSTSKRTPIILTIDSDKAFQDICIAISRCLKCILSKSSPQSATTQTPSPMALGEFSSKSSTTFENLSLLPAGPCRPCNSTDQITI